MLILEHTVPQPADSPPPRPSHLVGCEVEGVDLGLGEVVSAGDVALVPRRGEPRQRVDQFLLPGPVEDGAEVLAGLVGRAAGVRPLVLDRAVVDPVEKFADVPPSQLLDPRAGTPLLPLPEGREVLAAGPARGPWRGSSPRPPSSGWSASHRPPCRWTLPLRALVGVHPRTDPSNPGAGIGRGWIEAFRESAGYRSGWGDFLDCGGLHVALRRLSPPACWTDAARREPAAGSEGGDCDLASPA